MLVSTGSLLLRVVVGLLLAGHGSQKLFGWFGGGGFAVTTGWIGKMGLRPDWFWALLGSLSEFGGGILLALGFLNPLGSLGVSAAMLMAILKVHWPKGIWASKGGLEFPLTNLAVALALALFGPGPYSMDGVLKIALPEPLALLGGLALVILGLAAAFLSQTRPPAQAPQPGSSKA
ncbi:MAG: DoxX family protein [Anaerolineales bacterium]|jgi:putative oxidoreductase